MRDVKQYKSECYDIKIAFFRSRVKALSIVDDHEIKFGDINELGSRTIVCGICWHISDASKPLFIVYEHFESSFS